MKVWNALTLDNEPNPAYKKIANLNKHIHIIKEMDGAKNKIEITTAIDELKKWQDNTQQENDNLSLVELEEKQQILTTASGQFNTRFYLLITCVIANATTMGLTMCVALMGNLTITEKSLLMGTAGIGMVEGSIHLYKAKRFFVQKYQIAQRELESVNAAIATKKNTYKL
jgi:hypothetical protein